MATKPSTGAAPPPAPAGAPESLEALEETRASAVLEAVEAPTGAASVLLSSGRRYEMVSDPEGHGDRLVIRGRGGEVVLRVEVTDAGPVLSFSGAVVELAASRRLQLTADEVAISTARDLAVDVGGALRETVAGDHHLRAGGDARVEAAQVELQASERGVSVRAMEAIALDAEHIGLNDDPEPRPFPWSAIAEGPDDTD